MKKFLVLSLASLLSLGACSDGSEPGTASSPEPPAAERTEASGKPTAGGTPKSPEPKKRQRGRSDEGEDPVGETEGSVGEGSKDGGDVFNDGGGEDDNSSALHPAAGRYVYSQTGYERFCQAATCDQQPLPARQPIVVTVQQPGVVVSEIRASDNRIVRTTTVFSRKDARVTHVYARFSYEGFSFENSYEPRPPVVSLRFPLKEGARWSGSWEDSTSGDYSVDVLGREGLEVNGAAVQAYKLATVTNFRGEFSGSSKALVWVDPATKAVVKTSGKLDLRSSFGRYVTEFNNMLRSGPGYP